LPTPRATDPISQEPRAIRGVTVGPIESALHPDRGYGTASSARTMRDLARLGATWVSLTPFGRIADLHPTGIDWTFETPFEENRRAMLEAMRQAHAAGLRVLLVPHLWVETGDWRGELAPGSDAAWARWAASYRAFVLAWADVAERGHADMLSVGVELRSWVTSLAAGQFFPIIDAVRRVYRGSLTYSANWDDADDNVLWGALDVIGINAFYPLAEHNGARFDELLSGGRKVAARVHALAERWQRPVVFTELGYTTRPDPAVRPWEWPDRMKGVPIDARAQAEAYRALLAPLLEEPRFAGFFVWRVYADPDDASQEAEWGFSPRGKLAELTVRDAFSAHFRSDGPALPGLLPGPGANIPGSF
jgi:hypothetical protein